MNALEQAYNELVEAALAFAATGEADLSKRLTAAAETYAKAKWAAKPARRPEAATSGLTIPFGKAKGRTVGEADTRDLKWVLGVVNDSIDDESKQRWRDQNERLANAIQHELERRGDA